MPCTPPVAAIAAALLVAPAAARAQVSLLDKVFGRVTDVNAHFIAGGLLAPGPLFRDSTSAVGVTGVGFEVSLSLGTVWERSCQRTAPRDTTVTEIRRHRPGGERVVVSTVTPGKPTKVDRKCRDRSLSAELALGYTLLTGFRGDRNTLRTAVEELPALSIYLQYDFEGWVAPYLGLRTGLTQLKGARAYLDDVPLTAGGTTYLLAAAPGVVVGPDDGAFAAFLEFALSRRRFASVDWSSPGPVIPPEFREPFIFSTWSVAAGIQVAFGG